MYLIAVPGRELTAAGHYGADRDTGAPVSRLR